jgi:hypothetical protein
MKKLLTAMFILVNLSSFGQTADWNISITSGLNIGGPAGSLKKQMIDQGFDETSDYNFFGWTGTTDYPTKGKTPSLMFRVTKKVNPNRSLYFMAGLADQGNVTGFKNNGYTDLWGILGSSDGPMPRVKYSIYQFMGGFMYASSKGGRKLGFGPSLNLFNYKVGEGEKQTAFVPGATVTGRLPLGRERRAVGVELIADLNMAPPVTIKDNNTAEGGFHPGKVSMFSLGFGLALTVRGGHTSKTK